MKYFLTFLLLVTVLNFTHAQEIYLAIGRNFTTYDYTNSKGESNPNINSSSGMAYEVGYVFPFSEKFGIAAALTLDEFNATGGNFINSYSWDTNYLGAQAVAKYALIKAQRSSVTVNLNAGLNFNHIISGEQKINGKTFKLTKEEEFKGVFVKPLVGLDVQYYLLDDIAIGFGYNYSANLGVSNNSNQKLNFNNSQLQFNILMSLN